MDHNQYDSCPQKNRKIPGRLRHREHHVTMKERLEKCSYKPKDGKDWRAPPEPRRRQGDRVRRVSERDHGSADTLIPGFPASEL